MVIHVNSQEIGKAVDYIRDTLKAKKVKSEEVVKAALSAEEIIAAMIRHAEKPEDTIDIRVFNVLGSIEVWIACRGSAIDMEEIRAAQLMQLDAEADAQTKLAFRTLFDRTLGKNLSISNRFGTNQAVISVAKSKYRQLILTLSGMFLGLLVGIIMKLALPEAVSSAISGNLFAPVSTMFLNALKLVVAPLVLLSIASSIADFSDMRTLGRVAGRVVVSYLLTSIVAIAIGLLVWHIFPIGDPALKSAVSDISAATVEKGQAVSVSIRDTIVGIIPSDIVSPFAKADMLQVIFIAVIVGVAVGLLAEKAATAKKLLNEGNLIFSKITAIIIGVMPVAVFCSMAKMMLSMDFKTLFSVFSWIPVNYFGDLLMLVVYGLMILVFARLNPLTFYKKYHPAMLTAFTFASSNSSLPTSMEVCGNSLGISRHIYAFSLPLGATINMDGNCITLMISALFMCKIFGVPVTGSVILTLALSIFVLSIGAPGVPGGALVCLSILLPQIGIPAEAISIVMGLYSIMAMMMVCTNVTGDAAVTLIVARREKMLDLDVYNR